jgi:hypothetical protein
MALTKTHGPYGSLQCGINLNVFPCIPTTPERSSGATEADVGVGVAQDVEEDLPELFDQKRPKAMGGHTLRTKTDRQRRHRR